ncbi:MAG: electron transport complex protein RnfA [Brevinema sp.]
MNDASYLLIFIMAVLSGNMVFARFLGLCPFFGVSKKMEDSIGMGFAVIIVQLFTVAITHPLYYYVLVPFDLQILKTLMFILVIASAVQMLEAIMKKVAPALYRALGVFLPLITTNCIVLGIALIVIAEELSYAKALWFAFCAALGFMLAMILMSAILRKVKNARVPKAVQGAPLGFFIAAIISIAFIGFSGLVVQ